MKRKSINSPNPAMYSRIQIYLNTAAEFHKQKKFDMEKCMIDQVVDELNKFVNHSQDGVCHELNGQVVSQIGFSNRNHITIEVNGQGNQLLKRGDKVAIRKKE